MKVIIDCPHCDDELEFEIFSDYQGEGVWGQTVEFVDLITQNCKCEFSNDEMSDLLDKAQATEPHYSFDNMGGY